MSRFLVRSGVVLTAAGALVVGGGSLAAAHVSVHADEAVRGGAAEIAFRVPTESDTAATVSVRVALPLGTPIAGVAVLPTAGWTYRVTRTTLPAPVSAGHGDQVSEVVDQVEWSAANPDAAVGPGEYQVFRIATGPLPETDRLVFKVVQTYDDGQVRRWIDEPVAGGPEPEHPAAVLTVSARPAAGHDHGGVANPSQGGPVTTHQATAPAPAWWTAVALALAAMVTALGAVVVSLRAFRRGGGEPPTT
ncbi:YcnI family copper-binding membrane protein [Saccharothrix stipae]